nr:hypothetical protein [Nostoc sp. ChiSLP01]
MWGVWGVWGERELMLPHPPTPPTLPACPMPNSYTPSMAATIPKMKNRHPPIKVS